MKCSPRSMAGLFLLLITASSATAATTTLDHQFRYGAERFRLVPSVHGTIVAMKGASREFTPGKPDLPVVGENIEIPAGMRVTGVEVRSIVTDLLSASARIPAAIKPKPGLEPIERTAPDPAWYGRAGFPEVSSTARVTTQGWMRGRHMVGLEINPVRWDATSGRLERVSSVDVRLTMEPAVDKDMAPRERIVPEFETDGFHAVANPMLAGHHTPQPFMATQLPSVDGSPVAYVIITTDALVSEFQRLADWKTQSGVPCVVRTLSFIHQQYPSGADDADRMRQFIRDAYSRWGTKWVLLGGDTQIIPFRFIHTTFYGSEDIPCDLYFSSVDGNWNADGDNLYGEGYNGAGDPGDSADLYPEVYVGRAPVVTAADVHLFVNKNFQYTRTPVGDYEHLVQFFAQVLFPQPWTPGTPTTLDGAELAEEVLPSLQANPAIHYLRQYQNYTDPRWQPGSLPESRQVVLDSLNAGYNMEIHIGHGYRNVMSCGDANLTNSDALGLTNGNRLMNLYAIDCTSNAIDYPCIGEAFLLAPNGGAVTNIGSSRLDFPYSGRAFQDQYFQQMFEDSVTSVGQAQAMQKVPFISTSTTDNINRWTETTLLMLGDPELHQWISKPRILTVTHPATFALSETTMTVNVKIAGVPLYGARVTLDKAGEDYRSVTTDGAGNAVVDFRPGTTGSLYVTVTGFNCKPLQDTVTVTAAAAPVVVHLPPVITDDNNSGRTGNGDGFLDAGEIVDMRVPLTNVGGSAATIVNAVLATTDAQVTISSPSVAYGTISSGWTSGGAPGFRLTLPYTTGDQREIPFTLSITDGGGRHYLQRFTVTMRAPDLRQFSHTVSDPTGNNNGIADAGETINLTVKLRNLGTGTGNNVTAILRNYDGLAVVSDSTSAFGVIAPGAEVAGDPFTFQYNSTSAKFELRISDTYGLIAAPTFDLVRPATPTQLHASGSQSAISVTWTKVGSSDLLGYNIYHSVNGGPYSKVNTVPTDRTAYYQDEGLTPLTNYFYIITAVDSSGNESGLSGAVNTSTNPPNHAIFPIEMGQATPASVAIDYVYQATMMDIFAGSNLMYAWHADGTAPLDADGTSVTYGDFSLRGAYFAAGASLAKLDKVNWSIISPSWDSTRVYVFDKQGNVRAGWPVVTSDPVWSCVSVGDLNGDGSNQLVFGSNGTRIYAFRSNGTEWMDGDSNPSTIGVFKILPAGFNPGTPALADIENTGKLDVIYGGADGNLYVWRPDGTNVPGFPVMTAPNIRSSPAVGYLDGVGDTHLDIVLLAPNDSLYVFKTDGGRRTGFPVYCPSMLMSKNPSPALADMNNDGFLDIVAAGEDGKIYVYDRNGNALPAFASSRYSNLTSAVSESSPVVADIDGDGLPDIVMGDENGVLNGISGTGAVLPGFPIQLGGEVRGTPALCDCDGDGKSEIVVSSWDRNTYVWDYDFAFSPAGPPPWPQFMHDARRTGLASNPAFTGVGLPGVANRITRVELESPAPNPVRTTSRIAWAVPTDRAGAPLDLAIFDLAGRRVTTLAAGTATAGRFAVEWDASARGAHHTGGIYFVRLRLGPTVESRKLIVMP
ncbi:MAG: VCBS repeat-containing protein [Candidatus Eisenbacteria bacterium]|uniref:VCBS repeat-containing protein n=1 Tax=Eiseniibacteriota bacterium TaxID=2212470 RepID=A0A9D6QJG5_UNCEI|nr:VCBS repeat-containing protein [Candidatus Eisenbacteria bacterium]MBI3539151.1 VCBS repeat-containing protein [Candidatus Eisenbacteria bacterium]